MLKREFPILEFDDDKNAFINPDNIHKRIDISERAVLCFFGDAVEKLKREHPFEIKYTIKFETYFYPVYEFDYNGQKVVVVHMHPGAPVAVGMVDELNALGCTKFIVCGGCGVLSDLPVGNLLIPVSAVRDEGASYHYLPPSREAHANEQAVKCIEKTLTDAGVRYSKIKTWTTDAFFRETEKKIQMRKEEGCTAVEMEASAFMAAAQFREVVLGQILYAGDNLSGDSWDVRDWNLREDIRETVLKLSIGCCLEL